MWRRGWMQKSALARQFTAMQSEFSEKRGNRQHEHHCWATAAGYAGIVCTGSGMLGIGQLGRCKDRYRAVGHKQNVATAVLDCSARARPSQRCRKKNNAQPVHSSLMPHERGAAVWMQCWGLFDCGSRRTAREAHRGLV